MIDMSSLMQLIIVGFCSGIGSTVGNYFATKHIINRIEGRKQ